MINVEAIPQELKDRPQWVCWQKEFRDGKPTKVPYNPSTRKRADSQDRTTWGTFEKALNTASQNGFKGIGFVFSADDPYCGVDLDKCRDVEKGEIGPRAQALINKISSYSEASPSKTGVHIIVKATLPPKGRRKGKVEMYDSGRYFTFTGDHLEGTPTTIQERQAELEALHKEIFGNSSGEHQQAPGDSTKTTREELSDDDLVERIRKSKNANKFFDLWHGDLDQLKFQRGYPSASEADLALCGILGFWTVKNAEQMDRLFRRSGLMRPKWDEYRGDTTYGEITIAKAIADTQEVWKGAKKKRRAKRENKTSAPEKTGLPVIQINNRQLRDTTTLAITALLAANAPLKSSCG